ncbi:MAG: HD domain-containing phosphohydrolase [Armatimonadota bacterium]
MLPDKVLFVDDDQTTLDAIRRSLHSRYNLTTTTDPQEALEMLRSQGPFSVLVADHRMPGIDGASLLAKASQLSPDTVRVMLTGVLEIETAVKAVNQGHVFRFLPKPCPVDEMAKVLDAAVQQYHLVVSQRILLENTLKGIVRILTEILSITNPVAFTRAEKIRDHVAKIVKSLHLPSPWQYEVAALLSQIGCVAIPRDVLERAYSGKPLSQAERSMLASHPDLGKRLIATIPRLEEVSAIIGNQQKPSSHWDSLTEKEQQNPVVMGARILKLACDYDILLSRGVHPQNAIDFFHSKPDVYYPPAVNALQTALAPPTRKACLIVRLDELRDGMRIEEDIRTESGIVLVSKGCVVTEILRKRLENYAVCEKLPQTVRVSVPDSAGTGAS